MSEVNEIELAAEVDELWARARKLPPEHLKALIGTLSRELLFDHDHQLFEISAPPAGGDREIGAYLVAVRWRWAKKISEAAKLVAEASV